MSDTFLKRAEDLTFGDYIGDRLASKMVMAVYRTIGSVRVTWNDGDETWHDRLDWFVLTAPSLLEDK